MAQGYVAIVLHAHLPFIRHPEHSRFMEEDWLYEAITETYIPLINMMEGLLRDDIDFRLTMTLSPPLCSMLMDPLLQNRFIQHITRLIELTDKEIHRTRHQTEFHELAWHYHHKFHAARNTFCDQYHRNLVSAFKKFQDAIELCSIFLTKLSKQISLSSYEMISLEINENIVKDHLFLNVMTPNNHLSISVPCSY